MQSSIDETTITLHLDPDRRSAMQELLMARQKQLKQRIEMESREERREELRTRLRILAEFTNSINGSQTARTDQGLPAITHQPDEADARRLHEELYSLHTIVRPKATLGQNDVSLDEMATRLAGWAHRTNFDEVSSDLFFTDPSGYD